ncbi:hypothetical protein [Edaphosphingomonas haloaromaticamans]|uniref:Uncharacterized protein n=1 Tax=Edaphosphingomonas haloaromaticamans TaxID=653954 RepID=A0A1S1HAL5_9SPHN|nr:hypothetical protein [Sphingomonas haloaromaticamans]OHT19177.1 hypothetical protein BHE75_01160 [Sphingomonas haloaromaticamans]
MSGDCTQPLRSRAHAGLTARLAAILDQAASPFEPLQRARFDAPWLKEGGAPCCDRRP